MRVTFIVCHCPNPPRYIAAFTVVALIQINLSGIQPLYAEIITTIVGKLYSHSLMINLNSRTKLNTGSSSLEETPNVGLSCLDSMNSAPTNREENIELATF